MTVIQPGVVVVSPNVAIDSYYVVPTFARGEVVRASWSAHTAGGKGINLARAFKSLGGTPYCLGVAGGLSGDFVASELEREGIPGVLIRVTVPTRRTTSIIESGTGATTVIADPGDRLPLSAAQELSAAIAVHGSTTPWIALVGSLPDGFPDDYFAEQTRLARSRGQAVALDTSGRSLEEAMLAGPSLVKVNRSELAEVLGASAVADASSLQTAFGHLAAHGVDSLIVTDGAHGAYVLGRDSEPFMLRTRVERVVSAVGAGDTFLAAFIRSHGQGGDLREVLHRCIRGGRGQCHAGRVRRARPRRSSRACDAPRR